MTTTPEQAVIQAAHSQEAIKELAAHLREVAFISGERITEDTSMYLAGAALRQKSAALGNDEYVGLAVWCVSIADHHADVLTRRQIEKLYAAGDALRSFAHSQPASEGLREARAMIEKFDNRLLAISHRRTSAKRDELLAELQSIRDEMCRSAALAAHPLTELPDGDGQRYDADTPSARITGDKDRENPVEGAQPLWPIGTLVRKRSGGQWHGRVCGYYTTDLTAEGYAVESLREPGSVQIYPRKALELWEQSNK